MAIDIYAPSMRFGFLEQPSGFGTPIAASGAFRKIYVDPGSVSVDPNIKINDLGTTSAATISKEKNRAHVDTTTGLKRLSFSMYATVATIADMMAGAFQSVSEAIDPFTNVFDIPLAQIDFAAGSTGHVYTFAFDTISGSDGVLFQNAICDRLLIECNLNGEGLDKLVKLTMDWVGTTVSYGQNLSGTWVDEDSTAADATYTPTHINSALLNQSAASTITSGAVNMGGCVRFFSLEYNNNVTSDCTSSGGLPNNFKIAPEVFLTVDIPYNSTTFAAVADFADGSNVIFLDFATGDESTTGHFSVSSPYNELVEPPFVINGDYAALRLRTRVLYPSDDWGAAEIWKMTTDVDHGW